jgi:hypothetical protein
MRIALIIVICSAFLVIRAQDVTTTGVSPETDSVRNHYIQGFPEYFSVYPLIKQRSLNFELEKQGDVNRTLVFRPNTSYSIGLGLYLFELNVELAFAVPIDEKSFAVYGESKARDLQLNVLGKKWGLDVFHQKYVGFYLDDSGSELFPGIPFPQRPDIASRNIGVTGSYVFNNRKFSFPAAYNFAERQRYKKGSFLLFSSLSEFRLSADSSIINPSLETIFGSNVSFTKLRYTSLSIAPGYTYTFVLRSFFVNGTLSIGPSHHWIRYRLRNAEDRNDIAVNSFVAVRLGLGYNGQRIFGGISYVLQRSNVKFEDVRFSNNNGTFKILFGYRFREFGILKKRVWDFLPFKI